MTFNFNDIFRDLREPDHWENEYLTDNPPCKTCQYKIELRNLHPGNTTDDPSECRNCVKRLNYVTRCIQKLAYLEKKQKEKRKKEDERTGLDQR